METKVNHTMGGLGTPYKDWHAYDKPGTQGDVTYIPEDLSWRFDNDPDGAEMWSTFTNETWFKDSGENKFKIYISQSPKVATAWKGFILDPTLCEGFTNIGIERINDSVRTFVYCVLGAQSQAKTGLLTLGSGLEAKRQFVNLLETSIDSPVDLQDSLQRYQDVLKYARSKLDFVLGKDLYIMPSDMNLKIGHYKDYNNNILIASDNDIGKNDDLNNEPILPTEDFTPKVQGHTPSSTPPSTSFTTPPSTSFTALPTPTVPSNHEPEKSALTIGVIAIVLGIVSVYEIFIKK